MIGPEQGYKILPSDDLPKVAYKSDKRKDKRFKIIAGPCVIETHPTCAAGTMVAGTLMRLQDKYPDVQFIFKSSFDKANRTSIESYRGVGIEHGVEFFQKIKDVYNLPVLTDVHKEEQAYRLSKVVDYLQVPAFLCRQTDLIEACVNTGLPVNVKKGQFLSPDEAGRLADKLDRLGAEEFYITERGTTFGYNNLVVDFTSIEYMKSFSRVIFDATHSVQKPGGNGSVSGGNREMAEVLAKAAIAVGVSGLFFEVHPNPEKALSDGPNQIYLEKFEGIVDRLLSLREKVQELYL